MKRRDFLRTTALASGAGLAATQWPSAFAQPGVSLFPQLDTVGDDFTFLLIADPQVSTSDTKSAVGATTQRRLSETVDEVNARTDQPAFVVFNGDLVGSVNDWGKGARQIENFMTRVRPLKPLSIFVHGNHDGSLPWEAFKWMQHEINGTEKVLFSWDCGQWHFVAFPCNFPEGEPYEREMVAWLKEDLEANRDKPTMVFEHYHLMPQGLTQLEFYTYEKPLRTELLEVLAANGNVRYVICGHVHNGIKAAQKTAWTYKGMNFITAPTGTASRNFGEEYPEFAAGADQLNGDTGGGYYLEIDIRGKDAAVKGRLVNVKEKYVFPATFRPYENQERLWIKQLTDYPANGSLVNGVLDKNLDGWHRHYRYIADENPGFVWEHDAKQQAARLYVREKGQPWAKDEMTELYQMVEAPASPRFSARYAVDSAIKNGGGYLRLCAFLGTELRFTMLFDWGNGDKQRNMRMSSHSLWTATGAKAGPTDLLLLGERKQAMFWTLPDAPGTWRELILDVQKTYDLAQGAEAYASLGISQFLIGFGVWCQPDPGSESAAWFREIRLDSLDRPGEPALQVDGSTLEISPSVFQTDFGRFHLNKQADEA